MELRSGRALRVAVIIGPVPLTGIKFGLSLNVTKADIFNQNSHVHCASNEPLPNHLGAYSAASTQEGGITSRYFALEHSQQCERQ